MSDNKVEYDLLLKDGFSGPLKDAEHAAHGFHESVMHIVEALGLVELAHEAFDFLKESLAEFEAHKVAVASLTAMYNNNTDSVGMNVKQLSELAEETQKMTGIHSEEIMKAEQRLMKFKQIKISYEELMPVIADFAKATGQDASEAANSLGRALENPERAARLLMQAGVSPEQQEMYKTLSKTGDAAKAQGYLVEILGDKYKGVAKAMFEANPAEQMAIQMKDVKESIGELEDKLLQALMPALKATFGYIKQAIEWVKEHKEGLKEVAVVVGIVGGAFLAYKAIMIATQIPTAIMTAAQWALNVALNANPIGIIIAAITAFGVAIYEAWQHCETFRAAVNFVWQSLKHIWDVMVEIGKKLHIMEALKTMWEGIKVVFEAIGNALRWIYDHTIKPTVDAISWAWGKVKDLLGIKSKVEVATTETTKVEGVTSPVEALEGSGKWGVDEKGSQAMKPKSEAVKGQSHITINMTIQKMTGIEKLVTQTIKDGADAASDVMLKMLLGTVNQFSASADI